MLNPDFRDMLSELNDAGVRYLVVGAYALAAHGLPRATGDIDIWVMPEAGNAQRVRDALTRFGAPLGTLDDGELASPGIVFQIGVPPRRIDVMTSIDGVSFEEAWRNRLSVKLGDIEAAVLGREELIANKRAAGRPKDLADIEYLERDSD